MLFPGQVYDRYSSIMSNLINYTAGAQGIENSKVVVGACIAVNNTVHTQTSNLNYDDARGGIINHLVQSNSTEILSMADLYLTIELESNIKEEIHALVKSGIKRCFIASLATDPKLRGQFIEKLRSLGVEVISGVEEDSAYKLNQGFYKSFNQHKPYIGVVGSIDMCGNIINNLYDKREAGHDELFNAKQKLRKRYSGILTDIETIRTYNPLLTYYTQHKADKTIIIYDQDLSIVENANIFKNNNNIAITIITSIKNKKSNKQEYLSDVHGVSFIYNNNTQFNLKSILRDLLSINVTSVLVESCGILFKYFFASQETDERILTVEPVIRPANNDYENISSLISRNQKLIMSINSIEQKDRCIHCHITNIVSP